LQEAFLKIKEGKTVIVCVHGSSGMGKSTLIRYFLEDLHKKEPKAVVLSGRCYEQESLPYKALDNLIDALTHYLRSIPNVIVESLMPYDILALARLFPVLRQIEAVSGAQRKVLRIPDSQELRRRAFAALRELLMRLADRNPLVLFIDDLQWGDIDSAALLSELLRPPEPPSLLLITSHRSEEAQTSSLLQTLLPLLKTFQNELVLQELVVGELEPTEATNLASSLLTKNHLLDLAATIAQESRGNPFFINELVNYCQSNNIDIAKPKLISLSEVLQGRITSLPEDARHLLEILAIAGSPLDIELTRQAAKLSDSLPTTLATLRAGNLIRTRNIKGKEELELYHDRIRETILSKLTSTTQEAHHLSLAIVLESSNTADPEQLAIHFQEAKVWEKAFEYSVLAANNAAETLAFDHAAQLYQLAIEINSNNPQAEVGSKELSNKIKSLYTKLADALVKAGRGNDAAKAYFKASQEANSIEKLNLQRQAAEQFLYSGHFDQGLPILNQVLKDIGFKIVKNRTNALISIVLRKIYLKFRGLNFKEQDESQISPSELIRIDSCWSMCSGLAMVDVIIAVDFHMKHLLHALKLGEPFRVARALAQEVAYSVGKRTTNKNYINKLLDTISSINKTIQNPQITALGLFSSAISALFTGEWRKSKESCVKAEKICREQCTGVFRELARIQIYKLKAMLMLGELSEISNTLPALLNEAQERGDFYLDINLRTRISYYIMLTQDEPEAAKQEVKEAISRWSIEGFQIQHYFALIAEGEILLYQNQPSLALQRIDEKWSELEKSNILSFTFANVEAQFLRARCVLALANQDKSFLLRAKQYAEEIKKEKADWANAFANLIYAQIELVSGTKAKAIELLTLAEKEFETTESFLYAVATRRQRGLLTGSETGNKLVKEAEAWLTNQKIKNINEMCLMLLSRK
jgi:energy-coupling factor transporter ATP-binding protein EcfA2